MAEILNEMPRVAYNTSASGVDIMNYCLQNNDILANGLNGQTFTRDNFVELSNIIFNDAQLRTQLIFTLIDKIGLTYVASNAYYNQLKLLKKDVLNNGSIVEEIALDMIEPMPYNPEVNWQQALKNFTPVYQEIFHALNRSQVYPMTVNETLLRRASTSPMAFAQMVNEQFANQVASNEADEFEYFLDLVKYVAVNRAYPVNTGAIATKESYESLVALINTYANNLSFVSRDYNLLNFRRATPRERLIFITTSQIASEMNVYVNAPAYNLEFVKILSERTIIVPELPENCVGLLCDDRVFQIYDVFYGTDNNHNGLTRSENYFLHVDQIISSSTQFNCIAFFTTTTPNAIFGVVTPASGNTLNKGQATAIIPTITNSTYKQVKYTLDGNLDSNTQITPYGLLYIGQQEKASTLKITMTGYGGTTQVVTYYVSGNQPKIESVTPASGSSLIAGQQYQLITRLSNGVGTPTYAIKAGDSTITSDGLLTAVAGDDGTTTVTVTVGSDSMDVTYDIN